MAYRFGRSHFANPFRMRGRARWNLYLVLGLVAVVLLAWVLFKLAAGAIALVIILALVALVAGAVQSGLARLRRPRRLL